MNLRVWGDPAGDKQGQSKGDRERRMDLGVGRAPKSMDSAFFLLVSHPGVREAHPPCALGTVGDSPPGGLWGVALASPGLWAQLPWHPGDSDRSHG